MKEKPNKPKQTKTYTQHIFFLPFPKRERKRERGMPPPPLRPPPPKLFGHMMRRAKLWWRYTFDEDEKLYWKSNLLHRYPHIKSYTEKPSTSPRELMTRLLEESSHSKFAIGPATWSRLQVLGTWLLLGFGAWSSMKMWEDWDRRQYEQQLQWNERAQVMKRLDEDQYNEVQHIKPRSQLEH